jgi:hypothetical protein
MGEPNLDGLLLVGAYRDDEVDGTYPLAAMLARWRQPGGPAQLRLNNLARQTWRRWWPTCSAQTPIGVLPTRPKRCPTTPWSRL